MRVSQHAFDRAETRLNLRPDSFERLVSKVKVKGRRHNEFSGHFRHYMDSKFMRYRLKEMWVYGEYLYPFVHDDTLPTVIKVPNYFKKYLIKKK